MQTLRSSIPQLSQLQQPVQLQQAISQSGVFFEKQVVELVQKQINSTNGPRANATNEAVNATNTEVKTNTSAEQNHLAKDHKFALLKLINSLHQTLSSTGKQSHLTLSASEQNNAEQPQIANRSLADIWNSISIARNTNQSESDDSIAQLLRLLISTVNRVQSNQLLSSSSQLGVSAEPHQPSLALELPVWNHQGKLEHIHLKFEQEKNSSQTEKTESLESHTEFRFGNLGATYRPRHIKWTHSFRTYLGS